MTANAKHSDPRRTYTTPALERFGAVRQLTQSGSGTPEGSSPGNPNQCTPQTNRRPCGPASERRLKENIVRIGTHPTLGVGLYLFDYREPYRDRWGSRRQFGVMIDEVESVRPDSVSQSPDGFKLVDYGLLGIHRH